MKEKINELFLGDCLEIMSDLPDKFFDMILCDLPYGTTQCHWDTPINLIELWKQYNRIIKDNGVIALTAQTPFDKILGASNISMLRYEWIWEKSSATGHLNANRMPMKSHENILIFYKKLPLYNPQKTIGHKRKISSADHKRNSIKSSNYGEYKNTSYDSTERFPVSILKFPSDKQKSCLHPTQKPVALFEYLIKTYTKEGDIILDNCSGSGTTGIAAINTNRNFVLIEKDEKYYNLAADRINNHNKI